jgi:prepilin-type N-terminal cleavage/methylation domain-containing protein
VGSRLILSKRGFSLLELVIAVGILSAGITVVMQALVYAARTTAIVSDYSQALLLANDKLQELEFIKNQAPAQNLPKEDNGTQDAFSWHYTVVDGPVAKLNRLNFNISWMRKDRKEELQFTTYL